MTDTKAQQDPFGAWFWVCPLCSYRIDTKAMMHMTKPRVQHIEEHVVERFKIAETELWQN